MRIPLRISQRSNSLCKNFRKRPRIAEVLVVKACCHKSIAKDVRVPRKHLRHCRRLERLCVDRVPRMMRQISEKHELRARISLTE